MKKYQVSVRLNSLREGLPMMIEFAVTAANEADAKSKAEAAMRKSPLIKGRYIEKTIVKEKILITKNVKIQ